MGPVLAQVLPPLLESVRRDGERNALEKRQKTGPASSAEKAGTSSRGGTGSGGASEGGRKAGETQRAEGAEIFLDSAKQKERRAALLKDAAKDGAESVLRIVQDEVRQRNRFSVLVAKDKDFMVAVKSIMSFQEQQRQLAESRQKKKKKNGRTRDQGARLPEAWRKRLRREPALVEVGCTHYCIATALTSVLNMYNVGRFSFMGNTLMRRQFARAVGRSQRNSISDAL